MKSPVNVLLAVAQGLFKDVSAAYPTMRGLGRDIDRVASGVKNRGLGFFTLDLPNLDAILLVALKEGRLHAKGPCSHMVSKTCKVPRFLSGLWLRVFDNDGCLLDEPDITSIAFLRQLCCLGKKIEVPCSPMRVKHTMGEYYNVERELRTPTLQWDDDELDPNNQRCAVHFRDGLATGDSLLFPEPGYPGQDRERIRKLTDNLTRICGWVAAEIGSFCPITNSTREGEEDSAGIGLRHGPGAVADVRKGQSKYGFPNWPAKLQHWFPFDAFGVLNVDCIDWDQYPYNHEPPSKLCQVPKTAKAPRLIAAEPVAHQWCQQLILEFLVAKFKTIFGDDFITIKDQEPSRRMALAASLSNNLSTVDLSSASDRLSCWAIERMFKGNFQLLEIMHSVRTRWTVDTISQPKNFLKLRKFSTQGSALTFPIQSIFFLCCVLAVLPKERSLGAYRRKYKNQVRVFGDDIILPTSGYADLVTLLHYLGLKVNEEKSFATGSFRESCGQDAFKGEDVTPIKTKVAWSDTPTSRAATLDYSNNLFLKGYWHAAVAVESTLPKSFLKELAVVGRGVGPVGRISFCGTLLNHLKSRWNDKLHRHEVRVAGFKSVARRKPTDGYGAIFQKISEAPRPDTKWVHGVAPRPKNREVLRWDGVDDYSVNSPAL